MSDSLPNLSWLLVCLSQREYLRLVLLFVHLCVWRGVACGECLEIFFKNRQIGQNFDLREGGVLKFN